MILEELVKFDGSKRGENLAPTALEGEPRTRVNRIHGNFAFEAKHYHPGYIKIHSNDCR